MFRGINWSSVMINLAIVLVGICIAKKLGMFDIDGLGWDHESYTQFDGSPANQGLIQAQGV